MSSPFKLEGPGGVQAFKLREAAGVYTLVPFGFVEPVVNVPAASAAFTPLLNQTSAWFTLNPSVAQTITLPSPVVGLCYTFVVQTSATGSNTLKFIVSSGASGPQYMQGTDIISTVGGAATNFQGNGTSHVSFNMNGTTTGGLVGTVVSFLCLSTVNWQVEAQNFGSGTLATSFATS